MKALFREAELREEIEAHRAHRQDALEREGLAPEAAALASRRALGNITLAVEDARDVWAVRVIDQIRQDLTIAIRGLLKTPAFTLVTLTTLTLGIGANTALFSILNSLILRPLPVRDPGSLALLTKGSWSYPVWEEIRARETELFDGAFAWGRDSFDLSPGGESDERLIAMLSAFFGGLALLLAAVGLYGVVAHAVRARQAEIGLRMALGAAPSRVVRLVFQRVGVLIAAGVALGLVGSLWAVRFVEALLFRLEARDPATFAGAAVVLVAVGVLAAWMPARRAARLDPATVLREG